MNLCMLTQTGLLLFLLLVRQPTSNYVEGSAALWKDGCAKVQKLSEKNKQKTFRLGGVGVADF